MRESAGLTVSSLACYATYMEVSERGQALLIMVLIMVVSLTVGLSVASRSLTNLRTATEEESSQRAFSAAEAGIERAVKSLCDGTVDCAPIAGNFGTDATYQTTTQAISGTEFLVKGGYTIPKDDGVDVWLSEYSSDPTKLYQNQRDGYVTVYWGESADGCTDAAMELISLSGDRANPLTIKYAVDPCQTRRTSSGNEFCPKSSNSCPDYAAGNYTVNNRVFTHRVTMQVINGFVLRVVPIYDSAIIGVRGCSADGVSNCTSFPLQGKKVESIGKAGGTERKVTYFQGYPELPPELFQYSFFTTQ